MKRSNVFDIERYLLNNPDVYNAKINAIEHFVQYGWKEGRKLYLNDFRELSISDVSKKKYTILVANTIKYIPEISIIIPVYNTSIYLTQCLDSIIHQTFQKIEIICINDGSTDNSLTILRDYANKDCRISVVTQENSNAGNARNTGLKLAKGKYLLFLDSDDFFDPQLCEKLFSEAIRSKSDIVVCNVNLYDDKTQTIQLPKWTLDLSLISDQMIFSANTVANNIFLFSNNWVWNKLIKRSLIVQYNIKFQNIIHTNDMYFVCICLILAHTIAIVNERLIYYRMNHANTLTSVTTRKKSVNDIFICLDAIKKKLIILHCFSQYQMSFTSLCIQHLFWNLNRLDTIELKEKFIQNIIEYNFFDIEFNLTQAFFSQDIIFQRYKILLNMFSMEELYYMKVMRIIKKYKLISFDIFDTLVLRPFMQPADLFIELEILNDVKQFAELRKNAERKARESANENEITINHIYNRIPSLHALKNKEINKEIELVFPNKIIVKLYQKILSMHKHIILTSDMYLSEKTIYQILDKCHINNFKTLYLSNKYNKTKKSGKLFQEIIHNEHIKPMSILHIGDHKYSDGYIANNLQISTLLYSNIDLTFNRNMLESYRKYENNNLISSIISKLIMYNYSINKRNYWFNIGFNFSGPLCLSILTYIINKINTISPDCILFIARDCFLLHKIYNILIKNKIDNFYIYASRGLINNIQNHVINESEYQEYIQHHIKNYMQYKKVLLVDTTTINFTAQKFLQKIFTNAQLYGVYWLANAGQKDISYEAMFIRPHKVETINFFVESILSAPTPPVNIIQNTQAVFEQPSVEEKQRCDIYRKIMQGCFSFIKQISRDSAIKNFNLQIQPENIFHLILSFLEHHTQTDYNYMSQFSHTGDIFNIESKYIHTYFNKFKSNNNYNITIIVCIYNCEKYLLECLSSITHQTLKNIEIICVNDKSTDHSYSILEEFSKSDKRIKILNNDKNIGLASSRNQALKIAQGEYIQFVDADDYLQLDTCEELYKYCKKLNLDMCLFSGYNFDENRKILENGYWTFRWLPENWNKTWFTVKDCNNFMTKIHVSSCLSIYRREFLQRNHIVFCDGLFFEDNLFFCMSITKAKRIGLYKKKFYLRRIHAHAITQNWDKYFLDYIKIITMVLNYLISIKFDESVINDYKKEYKKTITYFFNRFSHDLQSKYIDKINEFYHLFNII